MQLFSVSLIFRYVEILIDVINIGVYYGTDSKFSLPSATADKSYTSSDNYGQMVLILFLILAVLVCLASVVMEAEKRFTIFIIAYNGIAIVFFFIAAIIILNTWSPRKVMEDSSNDMRSGGLCVGSLMIIQCGVLAAGAFFIFKQKSE